MALGGGAAAAPIGALHLLSCRRIAQAGSRRVGRAERPLVLRAQLNECPRYSLEEPRGVLFYSNLGQAPPDVTQF